MNLGEFDCSTGISKVLYQDGDLMVRTGTASDIAVIDKLQRDNSYAVGFIQRTIWDDYVFGGKRNFMAFVCEKNGDPVRYMLLTPGLPNKYAKIQQVAVREDARRLDYGTALVVVARRFCERFGRPGVTLRCRVDLPSNAFWSALGFTNYGVWEKGCINHVGFRASNDINLWRLDLNRLMPRLFETTDFKYGEECRLRAGAKPLTLFEEGEEA